MLVQGWDSIISMLKKKMDARKVLAVDLYTGIYEEEVLDAFQKNSRKKSDECTWFDETGKRNSNVDERFMTEDVLFGYVTNLKLEDYLDADKVAAAQEANQWSERNHCNRIGTGAAVVAPQDADGSLCGYSTFGKSSNVSAGMGVKALGIDNRNDAVSLQYKRVFQRLESMW